MRFCGVAQLSKQDFDELFERVSIPQDLRFRKEPAGEIGLQRLDQSPRGSCHQIAFDRVGSNENTSLSRGRAIILLKVNDRPKRRRPVEMRERDTPAWLGYTQDAIRGAEIESERPR